MSVVSLESFCNNWRTKMETTWPEEEQFCIYISNPFCRKICKYCIYKSSILSLDRYRQYYEDYLPGLINRLAPIIAMRLPDTFYFGGGTASLMDVKTMHALFDALPNLVHTKYKCFEANPASLTKAKIDVLAEYGFTEISLGVQSFDIATLSSQGRELASIEEISKLVSYATDLDIFVNVDLLTNFESDYDKSVSRLERDLSLIDQVVNPGKLTIYPRYEEYYTADRNHRIIQIQKLRNCIRSFCEQSHYSVNPELVRVDSEDAILAYGITDYHVYNTSSTINVPHNRYNCSAPGHFRKPQNVIGIGGFANQVPYSYIWQEKQWYMINYNWQPVLIERPFNDTTPLEQQFFPKGKTVVTS